MKFIFWTFILSSLLNTAMATEAQREEVRPESSISEEEEQSSTPKFSNLVRSTMDLMGPLEKGSQLSQSSEEASSQN